LSPFSRLEKARKSGPFSFLAGTIAGSLPNRLPNATIQVTNARVVEDSRSAGECPASRPGPALTGSREAWERCLESDLAPPPFGSLRRTRRRRCPL